MTALRVYSLSLCVYYYGQHIFKGESTNFTQQRLFTWEQMMHTVCGKKLYQVFCGSRGSWAKSEKLPRVMSLESALVGAEDLKFENVKNLPMRSWRSELTRPLQATPHLCLTLEAQGNISCY